MMLVMLLLMLGGKFYVCWRVWHLLPLPMGGKVAVVLTLVGLLLSLLIAAVFREALPEGVGRILYLVGASWLFIFLYMVLLFVVADVLTLLLPSLRPYLFASWRSVVVLVGVLVAIFVYGHVKYHDKVRVPLELSVDKRMRPLRIVAVSDLHLGYTIGRSEVAQWVDRINAERPDMVLIAGDMIDNSVSPVLAEGSHLELRRLQAPLGVYACLGNHEYLSDREACRSLLQEAGVRLLIDEAVLVDSICYVVGRDDAMNSQRKHHVADLLQGIDRTKPILLLDHQPRFLAQAAEAGVDLQVSGHTHDGQVWPINWIVRHLYEQAHGYLRKGGTHIYVSSGLGLWGGKFRLGTQSEYAVITLSGKP